MKITHLSSDAIGGAARAATRLHRAIVLDASHESEMIVKSKISDDWRIAERRGKIFWMGASIATYIDSAPIRLQVSANKIPRSAAWFGTVCSKTINSLNSDVINLHWTCSGFLSIEEIGRISKPIVMTLHDMWAFCGAEHLAEESIDARWRLGYTENNKSPMNKGFDIDRWVWSRKRKNWINPIKIVAPSRWIANCARSSKLMHDWDVTVIPNTLDVNVYRPISKILARQLLGLPVEPKFVLFGAIRGTQSPNKGWDLLQPTLASIAKRLPNIHGVIFGQEEPKSPPLLGMPLHWMGHLHDDITLALVYSAADVMVVPSRQEVFGQTGSEAQACGCPVVAFNSTGLMDVVEHGCTGYLATPYSTDDLARGIEWVLDDDRNALLSIQARNRAVKLWSHNVVISKYVDVYHKALG